MSRAAPTDDEGIAILYYLRGFFCGDNRFCHVMNSGKSRLTNLRKVTGSAGENFRRQMSVFVSMPFFMNPAKVSLTPELIQWAADHYATFVKHMGIDHRGTHSLMTKQLLNGDSKGHTLF